MNTELWVGVITAGGALVGALGGVWLTSYYADRKSRREIFLSHKKEVYVRIMTNAKLDQILRKNDPEGPQRTELLKCLLKDVEEARLTTNNIILLESLEIVINMLAENKFNKDSDEWLELQNNIRKELGVKTLKKKTENKSIWKKLKNFRKKMSMKKQ